jgi:hypothetical protein
VQAKSHIGGRLKGHLEHVNTVGARLYEGRAAQQSRQYKRKRVTSKQYWRESVPGNVLGGGVRWAGAQPVHGKNKHTQLVPACTGKQRSSACSTRQGEHLLPPP